MPTGTMSVDPGWVTLMNARTMVIAWVWISLATLACFAIAEEPCWDAGGALSDPPTPLSEKGSGGGFLPVPVWKFPKVSDGADSSDFGRPQFRCSNMSLHLRFLLDRYSDLRLRDGRSLLLLLDRCHGSVWTFGPWLLLELPYASCHMALKISNGKWFRQMEVNYFDYLQQASMTTVMSCEHPALSRCVAAPAVSCYSTNVTVKLPLGATLQRVNTLGKDAVLTTLTTPEAVFVQISTQSDTDYILEIIYLDSAGEMSTILASCTVKGSKQDHHQRGLGRLNVANYPYSPELSELIKGRDKTEIMETDTSCNEDNAVIVETQVTYSDSETINIRPDKSATPTCDGAEKQDDLPCCEQLADLPCCEPLDDLPCCNPSEEDLSCSDHEHEDPSSSQSTTGVHHGPFPGFSSSQYFLHSQSTSNNQHEARPSKGHSEDRPNGSHPLSDRSQSISINVPLTGSSGKTSSGDPPFLGGQPTSDYGSLHAQGHGEGRHEDLSSKGSMGSHHAGDGEGHPLGSQPSSDQSQSFSSHITFTGGPPLSVNQPTSDHGVHPSKGHDEKSREGHPFKDGEISRPGGMGESHPSKGHDDGHGETTLPGSQQSSQSQSLSPHVPVTGSSSKISSGSQLASDHGGRPSKGGEGLPSKEHDKGHHEGHPSKGGKDRRPGGKDESHPSKGHNEGRGESHPSKVGETRLPGSQPSSQSQSLSSHVPVTGNGSKTSSGGQSTSDHGGRPSKGHDKGHHEGHPSKGGKDRRPGGKDESHPSKGHNEGRGESHPSKVGETRLPGSQPSSQSQSLSSHVPVTGNGSKTSSGGQSTSDHGGRPSKGHDKGHHEGHPSKGGKDRRPGGKDESHPSKGHDEGRGESHPSKVGETTLPGSQQSSQSQSLSPHVPVTGSSSKTSSGGPFSHGQSTSDHGVRPSKGHDKGHHEGHPSKGGKDRRPGGKDESHPSKGHNEGHGESHPSKVGETRLPGSQPSSQSQSLSSHVPVTGNGSKTSSGGQSTSDHGGHPSKGGTDSGQGHPATGGKVSHPHGSGQGHPQGSVEGHPSKVGETTLPGSQQSSQSQSLSPHVPVTGSSSKISSGSKLASDHGGRPSKGHDKGHHEGHPSKGGKDRRPGGKDESHPSKGHNEGHGESHPSKVGETRLPGSQPSSQSQSLSSHVPVTGNGSKTSSGGQSTSDHGGHPSKGGTDSGQGHPATGGKVSHPHGSGQGHPQGSVEGHPSKVGETTLPGSQQSSQSQSLSPHVPVTGSSSKISSGSKLASDHGGRPSKGHDKGHHEGHPSKGGKDRRPGGKDESHPSKGHDEGRGESHPSKVGETTLPGSQQSSQSQSLSPHVPVTGSSSKISSGSKLASDHGGRPSKGHDKGHHEGHPSKGGKDRRPGGKDESHPSKGHDEGRGESHPSKVGETTLPGSQQSSQSQSLSPHVPVTGSSSKTSSGGPFSHGQSTSDHGVRPSKGHDKGHHEGHPSKGGKDRRPGGKDESHPSKGHDEGRGESHPSKGGKGHLSKGHDRD